MLALTFHTPLSSTAPPAWFSSAGLPLSSTVNLTAAVLTVLCVTLSTFTPEPLASGPAACALSTSRNCSPFCRIPILVSTGSVPLKKVWYRRVT